MVRDTNELDSIIFFAYLLYFYLATIIADNKNNILIGLHKCLHTY